MKILAVETSTLTGSVALLDVSDHRAEPGILSETYSGETSTNKKVLGEITLSVSVQHSERLLPMVEMLLNHCACKIEDIDLFAVSVGPGSFTGLRIGIAATQGFSLATGKPLVGVSSLKTLAMNAFGFSGVILPLINAFRGEVYSGLYQSVGHGVEIVGDEGVVSPKVLSEEIVKTHSSFLILGNGAEIVRPVFSEIEKEKIIYAPAALNMPRASHVGFLAYEKYQTQTDKDVPVLPHYIRIP